MPSRCEFSAVLRGGRRAGGRLRSEGGEARRRRWASHDHAGEGPNRLVRRASARGPRAAPGAVCDLLRDQRDGVLHGLRFPRDEPLRADRQPADIDDHRGVRRAGRAARHASLSAGARCLRLALCRRRDRDHHVGGEARRIAAGVEPAPAGLRALVARLPGPGGAERRDMAQHDPAAFGVAARIGRPRGGRDRADLRRGRGGGRRCRGGASGRRKARGFRAGAPASSTPSNGCGRTRTRGPARRSCTRRPATRSGASGASPTAASSLWSWTRRPSQRIACGPT